MYRTGALLTDEPDTDQEQETPTEEGTLSYKQTLKRKRGERSKIKKSKYHRGIRGAVPYSAAEVEHIWSAARNILTWRRSSMSPVIFEMIMFLKYNKRLWGLAEVVEANKRRQGKRAMTESRKATRAAIEKSLNEIAAWEATVGSDENEGAEAEV